MPYFVAELTRFCRNSAFVKAAHSRLVAASADAEPIAGAIDLLPQMLLPLCGPEEFDLDVLDTLPIELQLLPPDKKREPDPAIRLILVETLVLLATTRACREAMRIRGVYEVIKMAHLAETVDKVSRSCLRWPPTLELTPRCFRSPSLWYDSSTS